MATPAQPVILVTGATGTIGKELVKSLSQNYATPTTPVTVRLFVRDENKAKQLFESLQSSHFHLEYVVGDLTQLSSVTVTNSALFEHVERIFLLTPDHPSQAQIESEFIRVALQYGASSLKQLIRLSGLGSSGDADANTFLRFHNDAERVVQKLIRKHNNKHSNHPITFIILRANLFIQNLINLGDAETIRSQGVFYRPKGIRGEPYFISHVDVRDIADLAAHFLSEPVEKYSPLYTHTYNVTGPDSLSYEELAQLITKVVGKEVKVVEMEEAEYASLLQQVPELPSFMVLAMVKLFQFYKLNGVSANVHGDFKIVTGKNSRSVEDFLKEFKNAFL
ncbi:hypothetical protein C9374_012486 [Naegleria lovaniensis]|uniref:NmrA-like domain-containing protein n=1 Tax=Naegleria lovaniensis TaxID=51637 RepID=A0AA88GX81_NAELO|nr:uncharacterized protein C9374_012486 [Naegleria lovaniensis]KAG2392234.1 hypothetical protein C9374_012486 [Naegleria lovaniensis]